MPEQAKYSIDDIDALKKALDLRYGRGSTYFAPDAPLSWSCSYFKEEKENALQRELHTCMLAGIFAADIYEIDRVNGEKAYQKRLRWKQEREYEEQLEALQASLGQSSQTPQIASSITSYGAEPLTLSSFQLVASTKPHDVINAPVKTGSNSATGATIGWSKRIKAVAVHVRKLWMGLKDESHS